MEYDRIITAVLIDAAENDDDYLIAVLEEARDVTTDDAPFCDDETETVLALVDLWG